MAGDDVGTRIDDTVEELNEIIGRHGIVVVPTGCRLMRMNREHGEIGVLLAVCTACTISRKSVDSSAMKFPARR
jgi:hypothetical protein